ncbi:hypothetical protein SAMN05421858_4785 [Haladaptatus litoreus]|uniref:Uncharacterized protein n=1 Tax=Haladaptatus litoreus TaxID=553468 RepID=A0A1N7F7M0_9EURY|nr:hypothetical protein SAMN05421858_4785 [Haladaptatus litoreus]
MLRPMILMRHQRHAADITAKHFLKRVGLSLKGEE